MRLINTLLIGFGAACSGFTAENVSGEVIVINKGVGGDNTADALKRLKNDVLDLHPDYLIIAFGANDALNSSKLIPIDLYRSNIQEIIDKSRGSGIKNILIATPPLIVNSYLKARHPQHPQRDQLEEHLAFYDAATRQIAKENALFLVDVSGLVKEHGGASEDASCLMRNKANSGAEDGIHPTPEGYRLISNLFLPYFKGRVKPGETIVCFGDSITYGANVTGAGGVTGDTYPVRLSALLNQPTQKK